MYKLNEYTDYEIKALCKFTNSLTEKRWSKAGLVSLLKLVEDELGLVSIKTYAKKKNVSTQGTRRKDVIKVEKFQLKALNYN